ncbi:pleckstrin homology domain-containing family A member 3-like [Erpetoichthys calabaricus]|uniref:pleckstrin homology domain-containing family A member 3-like n=1 Tax=Erpetoichthys calabaricus TaxID=27687 RepID=UPI00223410A1|nr:pleckstrin homology domain-containing family A member 3-like [Erpetoichthys calabaricus]
MGIVSPNPPPHSRRGWNGIVEMEGILHKWTNYLSGWQPRYFVLDGAILSYYDSQDDVGKGSKGSIKMAVCEIKVHDGDNTRLDLTIPGEQCFYLKALNAAERQKWLVALGTAKACLSDGRTKKEKELNDAGRCLKSKMSELRLYCDLLLEQVQKIQKSVQPDEESQTPDTQKMTEASSLLKETCHQFLGSLEECMCIADRCMAADLLQPSPPESLVSPVRLSLRRMRRSASHAGAVPSDRVTEEVPGSCISTQNSGETVMRSLEEMVAFRAQRRMTHRSLSNGSPDVEKEEKEFLPSSSSAVPESEDEHGLLPIP